jgi:two-component sensor histidine kinase
MSLIHQDLYRKDNLTGIDVRDYLSKLTNNIFNTYQVSQEAVLLSTEIDPLNLDVDTIIPLGLIINELITNAMKYAFPEGKGSLFISLKEVDSTLQLHIKDDGVGFTGQERTDSFGFELIEALLDKLDGELQVSSEQGTSVDITLKNYRKAA